MFRGSLELHSAVTILTSFANVSFSYSSYQKDERAKTRNLLKMDALSSPTHKVSVTTLMLVSFFFLSLSLSLSLSLFFVIRGARQHGALTTGRQQLNEIHNKCTVVSCDCSRQAVRSMQLKMSIKQQHTLRGVRLFVGCARKVLRPTDRPAISTPVFSLPLSYRQMP